jgi:hypothetical protein
VRETLYRCRDRSGVVHIAWTQNWRQGLDWNERDISDDYPLDETICGETNFMHKTEEPVTCLGCLAEEEGPEEYS